MKGRLLGILALFAAAPAASTGAISGTVTLSGAEDHSGAVVYIVGLKEDAPSAVAKMDQKDKAFAPSVLAVTKGQKVDFTNSDKVTHSIFSVSRAQRFDVGLKKPGANHEQQFKKTGVVNIYCQIHADMVATVLVLPNRRYAVTDKDGKYQIDGVPTGSYKVFAWHPKADPSKRKLEVAGGSTVDADWDLKLTKTLAPRPQTKSTPTGSYDY